MLTFSHTTIQMSKEIKSLTKSLHHIRARYSLVTDSAWSWRQWVKLLLVERSVNMGAQISSAQISSTQISSASYPRAVGSQLHVPSRLRRTHIWWIDRHLANVYHMKADLWKIHLLPLSSVHVTFFFLKCEALKLESLNKQHFFPTNKKLPLRLFCDP